MSKDEKPKNDQNNELANMMNSFFEDAFIQFSRLLEENSFPVDIQETSSNIIVEASLPGYKKEQIGVEIIDNQIHITVTDHQVIEEKDDHRNLYRKAQSYSQRGRTVVLPFVISKKNTTAEYQNGILMIVASK